MFPVDAGTTPAYTAPEFVLRLNASRKRPVQEQDKAIDVYAYAITMFECIARNNAWPGMKAQEIFQNVIVGRRPEFSPEVMTIFTGATPNLMGTIQKSWSHQVSERPSFMDIRNSLIVDISHMG